ncbi:MAG: histidine kinase [bacterium]|nr:histidine kinase [bacterium]
MKPVFAVLLFLAIPVINLVAQEQTISLKLKEGHEYVFETTRFLYKMKLDGSKGPGFIYKKVLRVTTEKSFSDDSLIVSVNYLENYDEHPTVPTKIDRTDYLYPNFIEGYSLNEIGDTFEGFLSLSNITFLINLQKRKIKIYNKKELFEKFNQRLTELGMDRQIVDEQSKLFKEEVLSDNGQFNPAGYIEFLLFCHNARITPDNKLINSLPDEKLVVREKRGGISNFSDDGFEKLIPGKTHLKFWVDLNNGLITNYLEIRKDSITSNIERLMNDYFWTVREKQIKLLRSGKIPPGKLVISGKIENPLSEKVHIQFLDEPFGVTMKKITVMLDNEGKFNTKIDYSHNGFVFIENENNNKHNPPGTFLFYASPGDTIHFEAIGNALPWNVNFSGTRVAEARLLYRLQSEIRISDNKSIFLRRTNKILDDEFWYSGFGHDEDGFIPRLTEKILDALQEGENILEEYKDKLDNKTFSFISNELKCYFYASILNSIQREIVAYGRWLTDKKSTLDDYTRIKDKVNKIQIHDIYNDYGLYSRKLVSYYLDYYFNLISNNDFRRIISYGVVRYPFDLNQYIQFARMVLSGSQFYREVAGTISETFEQSQVLPGDQVKWYHEQIAAENLDLIIRRCNDPEIVEKARDILRQYRVILKENQIPSLILYNRDSIRVTFDRLIKNGPSVIYFSSNWIGNRYELDELAEKYPEIKFAMITDGSNFREWKEYNDRAEPMIEHYLLKTDTTTIKDIFLKSKIFLIFNKKGELINYSQSVDEATRLALNSLDRKKELNTTQLKTIIVILGLFLFLIFTFLILWKWRVRKRFQKEEQKRRLRELELTAIRSQMNPHFLFNCLNSVQNLVQKNMNREAHLYLSDFAGLIRKVLQNSEKEEVALAEEIEMVKQYLNLEQLRFGFDYNISVEKDIDTNNTMVPSMILQPFAENAAIHGLQTKEGIRELKIEVARAIVVPGKKHYIVKGSIAEKESNAAKSGESTLTGTDDKDISETTSTVIHRKENEIQGILISIEDNGIGREAAKNLGGAKNGKGSKLLKERLEILSQKQKENYHLEIIDLKDNGATGTRVEIFIPEEK